MSEAREVHSFISWNFFQLKYMSFVVCYSIPYNGVRFTSSFSYLDMVLSFEITFSLFCHNDGWLLHTRILSCGSYAFFQVYKKLK